MVGLIKAGTPHGGYFGIEEGPYAFQHGQIGVTMQILGILACVGAGVLTAAILTFVLKQTVRIVEENKLTTMMVTHSMRQALDEQVADEDLRGRLLQSFSALADHMRNRADVASPAASVQQL